MTHRNRPILKISSVWPMISLSRSIILNHKHSRCRHNNCSSSSSNRHNSNSKQCPLRRSPQWHHPHRIRSSINNQRISIRDSRVSPTYLTLVDNQRPIRRRTCNGYKPCPRPRRLFDRRIWSRTVSNNNRRSTLNIPLPNTNNNNSKWWIDRCINGCRLLPSSRRFPHLSFDNNTIRQRWWTWIRMCHKWVLSK